VTALALVLLATLYSIGVSRAWSSAGIGRSIGYWQVASYLAGWLTLVAALASPLDEWSDSLFAAHMLQHELLMAVAAPLIAFGSPLTAFAWSLSGIRHSSRVVQRVTRSVGMLPAAMACVLHAAALWMWHLPALYDAALAHESVHAVQHLSFFATGVLFWWILAHGHYGRAGYGAAVLYVFATGLQSGFLGALITLSPRVWYAPYTAAQRLWNVSPIEDQQLAGLIMWIPASVVFAGAGLAFLVAWLHEPGRRVGHSSPTRRSIA